MKNFSFIDHKEFFSKHAKIKLHDPYVGYMQIGVPVGLKFGVRKKPRWLTRFLLRILLEIEYKDGPL